MKKKSVVVMLVLLFVVSIVVSACGSGTGSGTGGSGGSGDSGSSDNGGANGEVAVAPAGEFPIVDEPVEITITVPRDPTVITYEYGENELTTWLEDYTGVKIKWNLYPSSESMEKLNLELSSGGDVGDIIMSFDDIDNSFLVNYGSQGVFAPLNDLIEEYGYYTKQIYEDIPNYEQTITAPDGNIYAMYEVGACYNCDRAKRFWVHSGFLETLGMDVPQTTDELYDFLVAVRDNDVNGNGDPNDEIGIVGAPPSWYSEVHDFIMNAFTMQSKDDLYVLDNTIHAAFVEDGWREGLTYLHKLYDEGLIDDSSFTNDENQRKQMVELNGGDTVAAVPGGGQHVFAVEASTRKKYEIVPPLEGPSGLRYAYVNEYGQIASPMFIIPESSEHKEVAFRLIDLMFSEEFYMRGRYGVEGVHWEVPPEGTLAANGGQAQYRIIGEDMWQQQQSVHWHGAGNGRPPFGSDARERLPEGEFDLETSLYEAAELYEQYAVWGSHVPKFFFDPETSSRFNELKNEINRYLESAIADFIVGNRDVNSDAAWEQYLSELNQIGLEEYLQIQQDEYDTNWAD